MAKIQKTEIDDVELAPDKYILHAFTLHTGEFETERYFEELDLQSEANKDKRHDEVNPCLSISRLLNGVKAPDQQQENPDE